MDRITSPTETYRLPALLVALLTLSFAAAGCSSSPDIEDDEVRETIESGRTDNANAIRDFEEAVELWEGSDGEDLQSVRRKLEQAVDEDDRFGIAWFNLGVIAELDGDQDLAREHYERAVDESPRLGQAYVNIGVLEMEAGNEEEARTLFEQALEYQPFNTAAHNNMSVLLRGEDKFEESISHARRSLAGDSRNTTAYGNLARVYYDQGNHRVARLVVLNGFDIDDGDADLYNLMGLIELARNEVGSAMSYFGQGLDRDPDHVAARLNLGAVVMNVRDYEQASDHFEHVLSLQSEHQDAMIALAVARRAMGDLEGARELYEAVLELEPDHPAIQFNLAVLEHEHLAQNAQLGLGSEAPTDPVAQLDWTIDNMRESIGHYDKAIDHYQRFLELDDGQYSDLHDDTERRIGQIEEIKEMLNEEIPILEQDRDMIAEEMAAVEAAEESQGQQEGSENEGESQQEAPAE